MPKVRAAAAAAFPAPPVPAISTLGPQTSEWGGVLFDVACPPSEVEFPAGAEIISADSRQVYRGMDIGTGKDLAEYEEIPYHLMDIVEAGTKYNIFEYQRDFEKVYKDIVDRGAIPILCGGSGLYIEAATCGYSLPEVPPDPELRTRLEQKSDEELIAQLSSLKPLHNSTDYDSRKRLIRALEIAIYEAEHPVERTSYLPKNTYYIGTLVTREERNARIDRRLDARIEEGLYVVGCYYGGGYETELVVLKSRKRVNMVRALD